MTCQSKCGRLLGLIGPLAAAALPALHELTERDADPLNRIAAAKAIAGIDPKNQTAIPLLVDALKAKTAKLRKRAAESLGDIGPAAKSAVSDLVKATKDPEPTVRWAVIDALGQIGPDAEPAVPALVEALKEVSTRGAAVDTLGQIGRKAQPAVPALTQLLMGDDLTVRWATAAALVRIGGSGARPGVRFLLKPDGVPGRSRGDAAQILTAPSAWQALPELIEVVREPHLRDAAAVLVGNVAMWLKKDQIPAGVTKRLHDSDAGVRCVAAWFLYCGERALDLNDVLPVLQETLKSSDAWARRQSARFLGTIGPHAKAAVPALSALLRDSDDGVR